MNATRQNAPRGFKSGGFEDCSTYCRKQRPGAAGKSLFSPIKRIFGGRNQEK
jgi:hypothetical protein